MAHRGRLIALEGGSASGKTTLVKAAARAFGWRPLPEALDRLDPAPSLEFDSPKGLLLLEGTLLAEEAQRYREARRLRDRGVTVLADTGFLGPLTYTLGLVELGRAPASVGRSLIRSVRAMVRRGTLGMPDLTVYLATTRAERRRRARAGARRHPPALFTRHEAVGAVERRFFEEEFPSTRPDRFRLLRAGSPPSVLARRLGSLVESGQVRPASRADSIAIVMALRLETPPGRRPNLRPNR